jgi:hypothetical protein
MNFASRPSICRSCTARLLFIALSALLLCAVPAVAASPSFPAAVGGSSSSAGALPLVASYWTSFWNFMEANIHSQQTLVQVGFIGMCLGLYIIIWKRRA